jgi:hypothetical protein
MDLSIEQKLVEEFEQDSNHMRCPPSLDSRIATEYRQQMMDHRGELLLRRKWNRPRIVLVSIIAVMFICGFAYAGSKLLFADAKGKFSINVQSNPQMELGKDALEKVRFSLKEVKSKLEPGETAIVYVPEFDIQVNGHQLWFRAYKPVTLTELEQWKAKLTEYDVEEKLPDSLLGSYKFVEGMEGYPFSAFIGSNDATSLLEEMKAESKKTGSKMLWRKTAVLPDKPTSPYTSVFRNSNQNTIYLTCDIVSGPSVKYETMSPPNTSYEELELNGLKAHYTKSEQSLYGDSTIYQDVMWIKESEGKTVVYHVGSDSLDMTKEQLVEIAKSLS